MLDRMEQAARQGSRDAARKMLDELAQMLNNLQMARPGQQGDDGDDEMNQALDQLGDMIRRQQQLRDRTFEQGQDQRRQQGQRGQKGKQGQKGSRVRKASRASSRASRAKKASRANKASKAWAICASSSRRCASSSTSCSKS